MAKQEKFWIEKKGNIAKWLPTSGFFHGQLDAARALAAAEASKAEVEYPCIVIMDGRNVVEIYHTNEDFSMAGV